MHARPKALDPVAQRRGICPPTHRPIADRVLREGRGIPYRVLDAELTNERNNRSQSIRSSQLPLQANGIVRLRQHGSHQSLPAGSSPGQSAIQFVNIIVNDFSCRIGDRVTRSGSSAQVRFSRSNVNILHFGPSPMHEALCRPSGATLDIVHAERRSADRLANIGSRAGAAAGLAWSMPPPILRG